MYFFVSINLYQLQILLHFFIWNWWWLVLFQAYEERIKAIVQVADELERENFHEADKIQQRFVCRCCFWEGGVVQLWQYSPRDPTNVAWVQFLDLATYVVEFVVGSLLAPAVCSPCSPVVLSPQKPTLPNYSIRNSKTVQWNAHKIKLMYFNFFNFQFVELNTCHQTGSNLLNDCSVYHHYLSFTLNCIWCYCFVCL